MCVQRRITISKLFEGHHRFVVKRCKKASFPQHPRSNFTSSSQNTKRNQRLVMITHSDWTVRNRFALNGSGPSSIALRRLVTFRFALVPIFLFFFSNRPMHNRDKIIRRTLYVTENQNCGNLIFFSISLSIFFLKKKKAITMHFRYQNGIFPEFPEIIRKPAIGNDCFGGNSKSILSLWRVVTNIKQCFSEISLCFILIFSRKSFPGSGWFLITKRQISHQVHLS